LWAGVTRRQAYDRDFKGRDDNIGEHMMSLKHMTRPFLENPETEEVLDPEPSILNPEGSKWIDFSHPSSVGTSKGKLRVQLALLSDDKAERLPAGPARSDPNNNPKLPPPERDAFSLGSPVDSLALLVGRNRLRMVVLLLCSGFIILAVGGVFMFIGNDFLSAYINQAITGAGP